jgi:hypothetical protein
VLIDFYATGVSTPSEIRSAANQLGNLIETHSFYMGTDAPSPARRQATAKALSVLAPYYNPSPKSAAKLRDVEKLVPELVKLVEGEDQPLRRAAAELLFDQRALREAVPDDVMTRLLNSNDKDVTAAVAIGLLNPSAKPRQLSPALLYPLLSSSTPEVRLKAADQVLNRSRPSGIEPARVIALMDSPHRDISHRAADYLLNAQGMPSVVGPVTLKKAMQTAYQYQSTGVPDVPAERVPWTEPPAPAVAQRPAGPRPAATAAPTHGSVWPAGYLTLAAGAMLLVAAVFVVVTAGRATERAA